MNRSRLITSSIAVLLIAGVVLVIAVSGGSAIKAKPVPLNGGSQLSVKHTLLGNTLVDANGRTLYLLQADRPDHSTLSRAGLKVWPAFTATRKPQAKNGVSAAHITTIVANGRVQVAYYGHPLYYFVADKRPGDTAGQGLREFGGPWFVISPSGSAVTSVPAESAPAVTESPGYHY